MKTTPLRFAVCLTWLVLAGVVRSGEPVEVIPAALRGAVQPQVAVTPEGRVFVAFGKSGSIYCAVADEELKFAEPVEMAALPKLALGMRRGPRIAATDQSVVVSAISHAEGNLYAWASSNHGAIWSQTVRINSVTNSAREGMHGMAADAKGNVHTAWLDLRNGGTELWGASSHDGGRTWGANKLIYRSPDGHICECCHVSVAVDGQGNVWAMWRNWLDGARDMFVAVSRDGGETFATGKKLGGGTWRLKACPMDGGGLAFGDDGQPLTVWRRESGIFAASDGGERMLSGLGAQPVVAVGRGGPCYLWQKGAQLMWKGGDGEAAVLAEGGAFPAVASASAMSPVVAVWETKIAGVKSIVAKKLE